MTYSLKYREKVFALKAKNNWTFQKTAEHFEICIRTLLRWSKRLEPILKHKTHKRKIDIERLLEDIDKYPDAYQYERAKRLNVSQWCVGYNLKKLKISYKKTLNHPKRDESKRKEFMLKIEEYQKQEKSIVYIDESGFAHECIRTHGYAVIGKRCYGRSNWSNKKRTNVIGALLDNNLLAPCLFSSSINTEVFNEWAEHELLDVIPDNCVIVMDNASFHKHKSMQKMINNAGHILEYLPSYSPDLNPIEHKWAQAKSVRKKFNCSIDDLFSKYTL